MPYHELLGYPAGGPAGVAIYMCTMSVTTFALVIIVMHSVNNTNTVTTPMCNNQHLHTVDALPVLAVVRERTSLPYHTTHAVASHA